MLFYFGLKLYLKNCQIIDFFVKYGIINLYGRFNSNTKQGGCVGYETELFSSTVKKC